MINELQNIKTHMQQGGDVRWAGKRISQIKFDTMNLGGDIEVRMEGSRRHIIINISEIKCMPSNIQ